MTASFQEPPRCGRPSFSKQTAFVWTSTLLLLYLMIFKELEVDGYLVLIDVMARAPKHLKPKKTTSSGRRPVRTCNKDSNFLRMAPDATHLSQRIHDVQSKILEKQFNQPPNPLLSPISFVRTILLTLRENDDPLADSGCRALLRSSTNEWRKQIILSIGAPLSAAEDQIVSALSSALCRPRNQFGILVGADCDLIEQDCDYLMHFPSDTLDFDDGTCWVECCFRSTKTSELLAITGWELQRRALDGAWLINRLDWQDFRDYYRPGIGRQEWIRVFG